jgi:Na+/proline symporter
MPQSLPLAFVASESARFGYLLILLLCLGCSVGIGYYFSRRQTEGNSYFIGRGDMPGWLVGFSITASMISTMTFLAIPAFSFKEDYRWVVPAFSFFIMGLFAMAVLVPFFRRASTPSGYAFLEQRFGPWARLYAAGGFLLFNVLRLGVVLYVTCLSLEVFFGISALWLMLILGIVTTLYTMMGGFEAVVWTEFFQAIILVAGAVLMVPMVLNQLPDGWATVWEVAQPAGKMSLGSLELTLAEKTVWVMVLASLFYNASDYSTRQDFIQRYRAPRTATQARIAIFIAAVTVVPIWLYFNFLGTALWTFYELNPDHAVAEIAKSSPEKIVPYFMTSHLSPLLNGVILAALIMASLSTLAPILNACAATWVGDFHHRILGGRSGTDQLRIGRRATQILGGIAVLIAILIHLLRTQTLQDLQATGQMLFSAGMFGLFMVGFFGRRIGARAALYAVVCTLTLVSIWFGLHASKWVTWVPDPFWIPVLSNLAMPALALLFARLLNDRTASSPASQPSQS